MVHGGGGVVFPVLQLGHLLLRQNAKTVNRPVRLWHLASLDELIGPVVSDLSVTNKFRSSKIMFMLCNFSQST